jgi:hypothetical protein
MQKGAWHLFAGEGIGNARPGMQGREVETPSGLFFISKLSAGFGATAFSFFVEGKL